MFSFFWIQNEHSLTQISKGVNTTPEKMCECVNDVFSKHRLEERVSSEERIGIFPILKLWCYMMCQHTLYDQLFTDY
jgi:hypothetical protein